MHNDLGAHVAVTMKYLARSRVLLGFVLLVSIVSGVGLLPALFFETGSNRFEVLKTVAVQLHWLASMITAMIGLAVLWAHRRARSIKMIATKPTPFEGWVASIFLTAALVGLAAHLTIALATFALSVYWQVPYQGGFAYIATDSFIESLIVLGLLTAMSAILHPVIATIVVVFFNESLFGLLGTAMKAADSAGFDSAILSAATHVVTAAYYAAPTFGPFDEQTRALEASLRVTVSDVRHLGATFLYAMLVCACAYMATLVALRRRSLA